MNPERKEILTLPCLPGRLTPAETAWRLGFEPDHIPILVSLGLLKPLGRPPASSVKYFASIEIETLRNDPKWLAKASDALRQKWKLKNDAARKRSGNGHSVTTNGQLAQVSTIEHRHPPETEKRCQNEVATAVALGWSLESE